MANWLLQGNDTVPARLFSKLEKEASSLYQYLLSACEDDHGTVRVVQPQVLAVLGAIVQVRHPLPCYR